LNLPRRGHDNPGPNSWTVTNIANAPSARYNHTAVWTGAEMIVWGGNGSPQLPNTGGRYNLGADSWTPTSTTNAPSGREYHTMVWTGGEMIVWGGIQGNTLNTGGRYCAQQPPSPTSTPTPTPTATPFISISGNISYCANPTPDPGPNVMLTLSGDASGSTLSDGSGNYQFSALVTAEATS
jgi:hypothetical protein